MELTQLRYFLKVAELQHITKAANELYIAQPALTQTIHRLESELEVPLFLISLSFFVQTLVNKLFSYFPCVK